MEYAEEEAEAARALDIHLSRIWNAIDCHERNTTPAAGACLYLDFGFLLV